MILTAAVVIPIFIALTASILFFPKIRIGRIYLSTYWIIAFFGAATLVILRLVSLSGIKSALTADTSVNPFKILALFFAMTFLSVFLDETGFFRFLASKAVERAGKGQIKLFFTLYFLSAALTVFTSNDIVVLTLTPIVCYFCKRAKINPTPYLVGEFAAANTWSMALIIGNPTNIYLATSAGITFGEYFKVMALPTLFAGAAEIALVFGLFFFALKKPLEPEVEKVGITDKTGLFIGVAHLAFCLVALAISGYIGVEMHLVSLCAAASLIICYFAAGFIKKTGYKSIIAAFKRLPYQLIPFVLSMFIIVVCLEEQKIAEMIVGVIAKGDAVFSFGFSSFLAANLINNIPMSMLFSSLVKGLSGAKYLCAVYASVIGSNVGAFLTPVGALAGIMFTDLTERNGADYGFKKFVKYGLIISVPTLAAALAGLCLAL